MSLIFHAFTTFVLFWDKRQFNYYAFFPGKPRPFIYCLMTSRSTKMYRALFRYVRTELNIAPAQFMCDFEKAERTALRQIWFGISVFGCYFHFVRAIFQKAVKLMGAMVKGRNSNAYARHAIKLFQRLGLLPKNDVPEGLRVIREYLEDHELTGQFRNFYR